MPPLKIMLAQNLFNCYVQRNVSAELEFLPVNSCNLPRCACGGPDIVVDLMMIAAACLRQALSISGLGRPGTSDTCSSYVYYCT